MTAHQPIPSVLYLVFCGTHIPEYTPERNTWDMTWDRTVDDLVSMQFADLARVVEISTGRDVTKDMLAIVTDKWARLGDALSYAQYQLVEQHCGTQFARKFQMEDA